jgi:hypothetical protein
MKTPKYTIGESVRVFVELPYNQSEWLYGIVAYSTQKFATVKLSKKHYKFPRGYVRKGNSNIERV